MERNPGQERQRAHALLDVLPAAQLSTVRGLMEAMAGAPSALLGTGAGGGRGDRARDSRGS
jgi:hypothetical protein